MSTATLPNQAEQTIRVGLLWHSINSGNLGVGALTVSNLAIAREAATAAGLIPRFRILGFVDKGMAPYVDGEDIEHVRLDTKAMLGGRYWRALGGLDCALDIGAGDSFTDIYGRKRFAFLWSSKAMMLARRKPLVLSPQTIGPFTREPETRLAIAAMNRADLVFARDPLSFEFARRMARRARVRQAADVAFLLPFDPRARQDRRQIQVGLNVSGLLFNGGYTGANEFGMEVDYATYTRRLIRAFQAEPDVSVHLVTHVYAPETPQDDDGPVADQLAIEFPGVVRVPNFGSPSEAKSYISGLDFLVAGRMHACIAAYSSGVPVVPVAYSRKFTGLFSELLDYPHVVPVAGIDTDAALAFTMERFRIRDQLSREVASGIPRAKARLDVYRDDLVELFLRVVRRGGSG